MTSGTARTAKRHPFRGPRPKGPAPLGPPRVWTVWMAFLLALLALLVANGVVFAGFVAALWSPAVEVRFSRAPFLFIQSLAAQPAVILGSALGSALTFATFALVPAALSPASEMVRERLRLWQSRRWFAHGLLLALGLLGVGQLADAARILVGARESGSLAVLERAFANMPPGLLAMAVLIAGLGAGVAEELFFRGYMQTRLEERWRPWLAAVTTSLCFALVHFDPWHSTFAFFVGLYLAWAARRTGSILPGVTAHVVNNTAGVVAMSVAPDAGEGHGVRALLVGAVLIATGTGGFWALTRKPSA